MKLNSKNLKMLRSRYNKSAREFSRVLGIPESTYAGWERGNPIGALHRGTLMRKIAELTSDKVQLQCESVLASTLEVEKLIENTNPGENTENTGIGKLITINAVKKDENKDENKDERVEEIEAITNKISDINHKIKELTQERKLLIQTLASI